MGDAQGDAEGLREEESIARPSTAAARAALEARDVYQFAYGGGKLGCEDMLAELRRRGRMRYTALRLPDVFGPYDNIGSFLRIQALVTKGLSVPCGGHPGWRIVRPAVPFLAAAQTAQATAACQSGEGEGGGGGKGGGAAAPSMRRVAWVYAPDVARAVVAVVEAGIDEAQAAPAATRGGGGGGEGGEGGGRGVGGVDGETIHLAGTEAPRLRELVAEIARAVALEQQAALAPAQQGEDVSGGGSGGGEVMVRIDEVRPCLLPSVELGALDTSKASRLLPGFFPTPMRQAVSPRFAVSTILAVSTFYFSTCLHSPKRRFSC